MWFTTVYRRRRGGLGAVGHRAALATLLVNKALWINLPATVKWVDELEAINKKLETGAEDQASTPRPATLAQRVARRELTAAAINISKLLVDHAEGQGLVERANTCRADRRTFSPGTHAEVLAEARRLEKLALAHPEVFAGLTAGPDDLATVFSNTLAAFERLIGKPRLIVVNRATATREVARASRRGARLLQNLDTVVARIGKNDREFLTRWALARKGRAPQPAKSAETPGALDPAFAALPVTSPAPLPEAPKAA